MKKRLWIVKREVLATSLEKALKGKGRLYEITEADEKFQPEEKKKLGFKS
jgi:hypothetical protein